MDSRHFYYKVPEEYKGKVVELPNHTELEPYENHNKKIHVPKDACYLIVTQIGILNPTIMFLDRGEIPTTNQDYRTHLFTDALEKRLGLIFKKVDNIN